jgi:hypothetical protein
MGDATTHRLEAVLRRIPYSTPKGAHTLVVSLLTKPAKLTPPRTGPQGITIARCAASGPAPKGEDGKGPTVTADRGKPV